MCETDYQLSECMPELHISFLFTLLQETHSRPDKQFCFVFHSSLHSAWQNTRTSPLYPSKKQKQRKQRWKKRFPLGKMSWQPSCVHSCCCNTMMLTQTICDGESNANNEKKGAVKYFLTLSKSVTKGERNGSHNVTAIMAQYIRTHSNLRLTWAFECRSKNNKLCGFH